MEDFKTTRAISQRESEETLNQLDPAFNAQEIVKA